VRSGATLCADLLCSATSHITSTTIPNCLSVDTVLSMPTWTIPSVFDRCITYTRGLGILQNAENNANLLLPLGMQKLVFQRQGALPPLTP